MDISFSKDYKHNYLIIRDDRVLEDDYQLKMITRNRIRGLLLCQERMINGEGLLYYEVTSRQSFAVMYDLKPIRIEELRILFEQIRRISDDLQRYILDGSGLILDPEFIYMDIEKKDYSFVYYPFYECPYENNLESLLSYLMQHVDSEDLNAVEAVYQMADVSLRQQFGLQDVLTWFENEYGECDTLKEEPPDSIEKIMTEVSDSEVISKDSDTGDNIQAGNPIIDFIRRFWNRLHGYEEEELDVDIETIYSYIGEESPVSNAPQDETVYIPWVENSEQKLYGTGHNNKYHIDLNRVPITVGKLKGAVDMVISDNSLSRVHARFLRSGSKYFLQDLNSTNGSFKNGVRLNPNQQVAIEPGDEIGLGKLKFIYR